MKGRKIFGGLVPYDQLWRTGANENTTIRFSHRVDIGSQTIEAGTYALQTLPGRRSWKFYLYRDTNYFDVPMELDSAKLIYLDEVPVQFLDTPEQTFTINIYDITETSASLGVSWENVSVRVPIQFHTREAMEAHMQEELDQNIMDYVIAASYYRERGIELEKAKLLTELAMSLRDEPSPWDQRAMGITMMKLGDRDAAKKYFIQGLEMATAIDHQYLVELIREELKKLND